MSYKFSRRDFLKYSALTAVAVAGAGLLSGCEIQDPNNPVYAVGKSGSIGTTAAQLNLADENGALDGNFKLRIANGGDAPLYVDENRFNVEVTYTDENGKQDAVYYNSDYPGNRLTITDVKKEVGTYPQMSKGSDVTLTIKAENFKLPEAGAYTMIFHYVPRQDASELSISWKMTGENLSEGGDSGSTDGDNTTNE